MLRLSALPLAILLIARSSQAQPALPADAPIQITLEGDNYVIYRANTFDLTKVAKDPNPVVSAQTAFLSFVNVGDIKTLNGKAIKGLYSAQGPMAMPYRANPVAGQPIADLDFGGMMHCVWQILTPDGKYVGTIMDMGMVGNEHVVMGGSGAFQGATGFHETTISATPQRQASSAEDPANRRKHGGGTFKDVFYLYPKLRPTVIATANGPAIAHQDGRLVTAANPALAGETLTLYASGLGPVSPAVAFGQPFPAGAESRVNAPVEVLVNGKPGDVLYAGGTPGAVDGYQVNFQMPAGLPAGTGSLQLTMAAIPGPAVALPIK
jgi:hypothetical protein